MKLKADIIKCGFDELKKIAEIESKCIPDGWSLKAFEDWFEEKKNCSLCGGMRRRDNRICKRFMGS